MPRIEPLAPEHWNERTRQLLTATLGSVAQLEGKEDGREARPLNILAVVAHHPSLLEPFLGFASALALQGTLPRRESELLAMRTAWNCRSDFEWGHHAVYAEAAGIEASELARIPEGPDAGGWSERDRILLRAADELHAEQQIGDTTWDELAAVWNEAQLVEITFVVGQYTMLSMVANATGVALEEGLPTLPRR
jgi:alkylhydroperoxidase family enzyme